MYASPEKGSSFLVRLSQRSTFRMALKFIGNRDTSTFACTKIGSLLYCQICLLHHTTRRKLEAIMGSKFL